VFTSSPLLVERLLLDKDPETVLLLMSSGNYDGVDLKDLGERWVNP
jgi:hypothetical protein